MKLSEMSTQQAAPVMADIVMHVQTIVDHPAVDAFFKKSEGANAKASAGMQKILGVLPALLKDCYDDVMCILSVLTGKDRAVLDGQLIFQTISDVRSCWDEELALFFASSVQQAREESST